MSQLPVPIPIISNKKLQKKPPYPAKNYTEYNRWKKWLQGKLNRSTRRYQQIDEWAEHIYSQLQLEKGFNMLMDYQYFRHQFSWYLFRSSYFSEQMPRWKYQLKHF